MKPQPGSDACQNRRCDKERKEVNRKSPISHAKFYLTASSWPNIALRHLSGNRVNRDGRGFAWVYFVLRADQMTVSEPMTFTGARGPYRWLVTMHDDLPTLIESCPRFLASRYIAVTSVDREPKFLKDK